MTDLDELDMQCAVDRVFELARKFEQPIVIIRAVASDGFLVGGGICCVGCGGAMVVSLVETVKQQFGTEATALSILHANANHDPSKDQDLSNIPEHLG